MSELRRTVRQTHHSGSYVMATVESLALGYATVRIAGSGQRITNLPVVGAEVIIGDTVYIDYSAGVQPVVRKAGVYGPTDELNMELAEAELDIIDAPVVDPEVEPVTVSADASFSIWSSVQQSLGYGVWTPIQFNNTVFDTADFFDTNRAVTQIRLPADGVYFIVGHVAILAPGVSVGTTVPSITDTRAAARVHLELSGSEYGPFAYEIGYPLNTDQTIPSVIEVSGFINGYLGETVTLKVLNDTPINPITSELCADHTYPALCGFRLGGAGLSEIIGAEDALDQQNPPEEPAIMDISLEEGQIILPVSGDWGRAIANMTWHSDKTMLSDVRFSGNFSNGWLSFFLRSSGDWIDNYTPTQGYEARMDTNGNVAVYRIVSGTRTLIGDVAGTPTLLNQRVRFETNGAYVRFRKWLESESEPGTWDIEVNDTGGFTTQGGFQLVFYSQGGAHNAYLDNISVNAP